MVKVTIGITGNNTLVIRKPKKKKEGAGCDTPMMTMTHERKKNKVTLHFLLSLFHLSPDHVFVLGHGIALSFQHMPD